MLLIAIRQSTKSNMKNVRRTKNEREIEKDSLHHNFMAFYRFVSFQRCFCFFINRFMFFHRCSLPLPFRSFAVFFSSILAVFPLRPLSWCAFVLFKKMRFCVCVFIFYYYIVFLQKRLKFNLWITNIQFLFIKIHTQIHYIKC